MNMTVSEARAKMRETIERVKKGEEIHLTQNGEVVAVWLHPSRLQQRVQTPTMLAAEEMLARLNQEDDDEVIEPYLSLEEAEDRIAEIRRNREDR